ncbi:MAG: TIGR03761 family integrating conjugative element protein [Gammaproteobacteria bacterium]|nr:TIGR03761 family integrating conjugative element protein [Gammaproteobacteria bacterium]
METQDTRSTVTSTIAPAYALEPLMPAASNVPSNPGSDLAPPIARPATPRVDLGQLADETPDVMTLHTRDAYRLFVGRSVDEATQASPIVGGRKFAAVLRSLWHLSANDNPYADWILIRIYQNLIEIRARMAEVIATREAEFERLRRRGLNLSVLGSRSPLSVALGFRSPYGYATAEAIVEFDYHVRMIKTLVMKDRMSDDDGRAAIREIGRALRGLFLAPIRWERVLLREEMLPFGRRDFLPGADDAARLRVRAAFALFGEVPRKVFTGEKAPRHSQRRVLLTEAELRLLQQVSLTLAELPEPPAGELL